MEFADLLLYYGGVMDLSSLIELVRSKRVQSAGGSGGGAGVGGAAGAGEKRCRCAPGLGTAAIGTIGTGGAGVSGGAT